MSSIRRYASSPRMRTSCRVAVSARVMKEVEEEQREVERKVAGMADGARTPECGR
jgi:hypothetical protein